MRFPGFPRLLFPFFLLFLGLGPARAGTVFSDGFESGSLGPAWSVSSTNQGRAVVGTGYAPAAGQYALVLDDSQIDAVYSAAQATLSLDLTNKRSVVLTFQAKSLGNKPHAPVTGNFTGNATFDGVSVSVDGGSTWRAAASLANVGTAWTTFSVTLDSTVAALGGSFRANTLIRFSQYGNLPAPSDGIALDEVSVTADENLVVQLYLPASAQENGGNYTGYVLFNAAAAQDVTVNLVASPAGQLSLPSTVVVLAGQSYATFDFTVVDNNIVDFARTVTITPSAPGYAATSSSLTVFDDEPVALSLVLPAQLPEGQYPSQNATVSLSRAGTNPLTVQLAASPVGEVNFPSSVTVPAGMTQVTFSAYAVDDNKLDGNQAVTVTASATGLTSATATTTTVDNELRTMVLSFVAGTVQEAGVTTGTVVIGGTLTTALTVNLTNSNPSAVSVPASVTIPAGTTQVTFNVLAPDNNVRDGSRLATITATAATFPTASNTLTVRDNDPAGYVITGLTDIVNLSGATTITVAAADIEGNAISGYASTVNLFVVLPDGSTQPLTPATVSVSGTAGWSGSVTIPVVNVTPLRLRATDAAGLTGDSAAFDIMRVIPLTTGDVIWDGPRNQLYASVSSTDPGSYANRVVTINPATAQVTGSVSTGNNPGQLALTSAGEQLYVALAGNGRVARITPDTLAVNLSFALGSDPNYGTYYVKDMSTVAGQPNVLMVARYCPTVSASYQGVGAYDNGVIRPTVTTAYNAGIDYLEPSADPTVFFGYNAESSGWNFYRFKLDANGVTAGPSNGTLISGYNVDIRSAGDSVFSTTGVKVDGALLQRAGTFAIAGNSLVCPDLKSNRVFFLEPDAQYSYTPNRLGAYDPNTFALLRKLTLPAGITLPSTYGPMPSFVRWGGNGLAIRTATSIVLINSTRLVPTDPPANLNVQVRANPNPAAVAAPLTYTVTVTNNGPNPARNTQAMVTLSDSQTITGVNSASGVSTVAGRTVSLPVGTLANGAAAVLTVTASPLSAGSLTATASATSDALDPDTSDNWVVRLVSVGFSTGPDTVNQLRLGANNLLTDPARNLLWVSLPATGSSPLDRSVVALDPQTGLLSDPIALNATPAPNCMALSGNGRYLYVGLTDVPSVARVDLGVTPPAVTRIPLGTNLWGDAGYAICLQPIDGDGTSFLAVTSGDYAAGVYDGAVRRANRTGIYTVSRAERTGTPGTFVGYNAYTSGFEITRLVVTSAGVTIGQSNGNVVSGYGVDIKTGGGGNLVLSSTGLLVNTGSLALTSNLGTLGRPCLDFANGRAYLLNGSSLKGFDTSTGLTTGTLTLPVTLTGDWALNCVRWGLDGFAILGNDAKVYVARWSATIPAATDNNHNGFSDAWEARYFNRLGVDPNADPDGDGIPNALEYLFATSPTGTGIGPAPMRMMGTGTDGTGRRVMRLVFPRRSGLPTGAYGYEVSDELSVSPWSAPAAVSETVLGTQPVDGVSVDTVQADVTLPGVNATARGFVRLRWLGGTP